MKASDIKVGQIWKLDGLQHKITAVKKIGRGFQIHVVCRSTKDYFSLPASLFMAEATFVR